MAVGFAFVPHEWTGVAVATRDLAGLMTLRQIDTVFEPTGYTLHKPEHRAREQKLNDEGLGQRRARAQIWIERINWDLEPPYGLYESLGRLALILSAESTDPGGDRTGTAVELLNLELAKHGARLDMAARSVVPLSDGPRLITDLAGVRLEMQRIEHALGTGDSLATIGAGKNLVEATAKAVLAELGHPSDKDADVKQLVGRVNEALSLDASGPDLPRSLREILGSAAKLAGTLTELRNATDDSGGHGAAEPADWVQPEHARLVAEVAVAWSRFILAAYERRAAGGPPRTSTTPASSMSHAENEDYLVVPAPPGYASLGGTGEAVLLPGSRPTGPGTPIPWPPEPPVAE